MTPITVPSTPQRSVSHGARNTSMQPRQAPPSLPTCTSAMLVGYRARLFPIVVGLPAVGLALLQLGLLLKPSTTQRAFSVAPTAPAADVARARSLQMVG